MPSNEEDDDLELLRSAALASLRKKSSTRHDSESEDLEALRRQALTSRKNKDGHEEAIFEKLQPVRSSNLINLTPDPGIDLEDNSPATRDETAHNPSDQSIHESESTDSDEQRSSSSSSDSSEEESSESSGECTSSESDEEEVLPKKKQTRRETDDKVKASQKKEEDDLLDAIDQLLDEKITPQNPLVIPKQNEVSLKSKKAEKKKTKVIESHEESSFTNNDIETRKSSRKTKVPSPQRTNKNERQEKMHVEKSGKLFKNEDDEPIVAKRQIAIDDDKVIIKKVIVNDNMSYRKNPPIWQSSDLPLHRNKVENFRNNQNRMMETESIHSSDLSFLSDISSGSKKSVDEKPPEPIEPDVKLVRTERNVIDRLKRQRRDGSPRSSSEECSRHSKDPDGRPIVGAARVKRQDENSFPDLREKLRRRGLHRPVSSDSPKEFVPNSRHWKNDTENDHSKTHVGKRGKIRNESNEIYNSSDDGCRAIKRNSLRVENSERMRTSLRDEDLGRVRTSLRDEDSRRMKTLLRNEDSGQMRTSRDEDSGRMRTSFRNENSERMRSLVRDGDSGRIRTSLRDEDSGRMRTSLRDEDSGQMRTSFRDEDSGQMRTSLRDEDSGRMRTSFRNESSERMRSSVRDEDSGRIRTSVRDEDSGRMKPSFRNESSERMRSSLRDEDSRRIKTSLRDEDSRRMKTLIRDEDSGRIRTFRNENAERMRSSIRDEDSRRMRTSLRDEDSGQLVVTRKLDEDGYSSATVKLGKEKKKNKFDDDSKSFRRKRSVVKVKPVSPVPEKQKKHEVIEKQADDTPIQEANYFSDLSEDFDDFEIDEPDGSAIIETVKTESTEESSESDADPHPGSTRRMTPSPGKMKRSRTRSYGASDDEKRAKKVDANTRMRKRRAKPVHPDDTDELLRVYNDDADEPTRIYRDDDANESVRVRSQIKPIRETNTEKMDDRYQRDVPVPRQRHRRNVPIYEHRERTVPWSNKPPTVSSCVNWHRDDRKEDFSDRAYEEKRVRTRSPPPLRGDDSFRRRRRVNVSTKNAPLPDEGRDWELSSRDKPIRYRVGYNRGVSPHENRKNNSYYRPRERRKKEDDQYVPTDREKVVDAKIRRINEKNAEILKRRETIKMEERRFRVKAI